MRGVVPTTDVALDVLYFRRWMTELARTVGEGSDELTRLDAAIGDADHGINMQRGMAAAIGALREADTLDDPGEVLRLVGNRLVSVVGGASGPIYGTAFRTMGTSLGPRVTLNDLAIAITAALEAVQRLGAAQPGDKTMVDAWAPAAAALRAAAEDRVPLPAALTLAELAAHEGMTATIPMRARKGRASYLGWRSEGHQDPGATSTHMIFATMAAAAT